MMSSRFRLTSLILDQQPEIERKEKLADFAR